MRFFKMRLVMFGAFACVLAIGAAIAQRNNRGFDVGRMDTTCKPCADFYQYANGKWLASNPIPNAYSRWGSFDILAENNRVTLRDILESAAKTSGAAKKGSNEQKIGDFYATCMNEAAIEAAGAQPLAPVFARIEAIKDTRELQSEIARLQRIGIPALFNFGAQPDLKNNTQVIANAAQGGLSLPNRDYYTKQDEKSQKIREQFLAHMTRTFTLLGDAPDRAATEARTVMTLQTKLAESSRTPVALRDPNAQYNKKSLAELAELTPDFSWQSYLTARDVTTPVTEINIGQPEFFKAMGALLKDASLDDWKTYLRWQVINATAPRLSSKFVSENFNFYNGVLQGTKEQLPRWRRCVAATDAGLGEALGQVYVQKAFPPEAKARMQKLIGNLLAVYHERLTAADWMSEETRHQALAKLATFAQKIGYPEKWRDYTALDITRDSYLDNALHAAEFEARRNIRKIGKPVDRTEWGMTPPTVNAYYNSLFNEIAFPAGILQPPFFNAAADDALNYGAIGAVIGHEISHGFDDRGSLFDAQGNLRMWWTPADRTNFEKRAQCVKDQFSSFKVEENLNINGELVAGESIADLGGINVAYAAFEKSLQGKPRPADIDGFTPEQRFFLGYAQIWGANARREAERLQVSNDPHPLPRYRTNGPLSNMPEFAAAFGCKMGDAMVRPAAERCQVW